MDMNWECPEIDEIVDAAGFADNASVRSGVSDFAGEVLAIALGYVDESCVSSCGDACEEASCVTPDGATISYRYETTTDVADYCDMGSGGYVAAWDVLERWEITVIPAEGAWSDLDLVMERESRDFDGTPCYATYDASAVDITVAWTGTLDAAWPDDGAVTASTRFEAWAEGTDPAARRWAAWDDGTCAWDAQWENYDYAHLWDEWVRIAGQPEVYVTNSGMYACEGESEGERWRGFLDGERVGEVDGDTWALLRPAPDCEDGGEDTGGDDTGGDDTGGDDTGDTGSDDTGGDDTGDTGSDDTGSDDTGDTGTDDTGSDDTGDTGPDDTGADDTGDTGSDDTGETGSEPEEDDGPKEEEDPRVCGTPTSAPWAGILAAAALFVRRRAPRRSR